MTKPSKRKRGLYFALAGVIAGLVLGYTAKRIAANALVDYLDDMVQRSCDCSFSVDSVELSLFPVRAVAHNPRIVSRGEVRLRFDELSVYAGISQLAKRIVVLHDFELHGGVATGVAPGTPTYDFIDFLTEPLPPEKDTPDRWRAQVWDLKVTDAFIDDDLGDTMFEARGVELSMTRSSDGTFLLIPTIQELRFRSKQAGAFRPINLGSASGKVILGDGDGIFKDLRLRRDGLSVLVNAYSNFRKRGALQGTAQFSMHSSVANVPPWLDFAIEGTGALGGRLARPILKAPFTNPPDTALHVSSKELGPLSYNRLRGTLTAAVTDQGPRLRVTPLSASGPASKLSNTEELLVTPDEVRTTLQVQVDNFDISDLSLQSLVGRLSVKGPLAQPRADLVGRIAQLSWEDILLQDLSLRSTFKHKSLKIDLAHQSAENGQARALGELTLKDSGVEKLVLDLTAVDFKINHKHNSQDPNAMPLRISTASKLSAGSDLSDLSGNVVISLSSPNFTGESALNGSGRVDAGRISLDLFNQTRSINSKFSYDLKERGNGKLNVRFNQFQLKEYLPAFDCSKISATLDYSFHHKSISHGDGTFTIDDLLIGCEPEDLTLFEQVVLPIEAGKLKISKLVLQGEEARLKLAGQAALDSGYNVAINGSLYLNALLGYLPFLDDMNGIVLADVIVHSEGQTPFTSSPSLAGNAQLRDGDLAIESLKLTLEAVDGDLTLVGDVITIENVSGRVNDGEFQLTGTLYPFEFEASSLTLKLGRIAISPYPNTELDFSGNFVLKQSDTSRRPVLKGEVQILQADFTRQFDIRTLARTVSQAVLENTTAELSKHALPDIDLDIEVIAPRRLFVTSNWASGELGGKLHVTGTVEEPVLTGKLSALSGWFGMKGRRFIITAADITFRPDSSEPYLELLSESLLRSGSSDNSLVFLEAYGPISDPQIRLSSDRGLSEKEIVRLLSAGDGRSGVQFRDPIIEASREDTWSGDQSWLRSLREALNAITSIDRLSIEPSFDSQSGVIEPVVVATKQLSDAVTLSGQNSISTTTGESRLQLDFRPAPRLRVAGIARTRTSQAETALGIDVGLTVLKKERELLTIELQGNNEIPEKELRKKLRLKASSRLTPSELSTVTSTIERYYADLGFLEVKVIAECTVKFGLCSVLMISIDEGVLYRVSNVVYRGDPLDTILSQAILEQLRPGLAASAQTIQNVKFLLTQQLRSEGYIGARIVASYDYSPDNPEAIRLLIDSDVGQPVSFIFKGNQHFSPRELLDTINLFTRKQPFGANTINILVENIEQKYRRTGHLFATIRYNGSEDPDTGRLSYTLEIDEGPSVPVSAVEFQGQQQFSHSELKSMLEERNAGLGALAFSPEYAVAEDLDYVTSELRSIYQTQGFPDAEIRYQITPIDETQSVKILYHISEGTAENASTLSIDGYPEDLNLPQVPKPPYSIFKANRYIEGLIYRLDRAGYLEPALSTQLSPEDNQLAIQVEPGIRIIVETIKIEGHSRVRESTIRKHLAFKSGEPLEQELITISQIKLLKLGLFNEVDISYTLASKQSRTATVLVRVRERQLRTLELGGGVDSIDGIHIFAEAVDRAIFRDGKTFTLRADTFYNSTDAEVTRGVAGVKFTNPHLFDTDLRFTQDFRYQRVERITQEFDLDQYSFANFVHHTWKQQVRLSLGHTLAQENITNVEPDVVLSDLDSGVLNLSYISANIDYDGRDDVFNPTSGYTFGLESRALAEVIGAEADVLTLGGRFAYLLPLDSTRRFVFANNYRVRAAWTLGDTPAVPITQRLYLGGRNSVRGYRENSLGPLGEAGHVIGGDFLTQANFELRMRITETLQALSFVDLGTVYLRDKETSFGNLRKGAGAGLRYLSPIGPIGFDLGTPLDERSGEPSLRFHFSIGGSF